MTLLNSLTTNSRPVTRNEYGGLQFQTCLSADESNAVQSLLTRAVEADLLPEPYIERSKREFESLNHHIYDVLVAEESVIAVVVLALSYWKDFRKERTRIPKTYFLIQGASDDGVKVTELDGRTCAKRAKNAQALGQLTRHYLGLEPVKCATPHSKPMERAMTSSDRESDVPDLLAMKQASLAACLPPRRAFMRKASCGGCADLLASPCPRWSPCE
ncbi:hypothetical protein [Thiomonas sp. FB-Cd]|uniref:hypothetical protein n=1 Tax=Thiomonas sp. FB-Cd TaxID=1158292 RepID=UPI0004DFBDBC|nr:hypothetical protein [Thiomonas sp. FB-Cd]